MQDHPDVGRGLKRPGEDLESSRPASSMREEESVASASLPDDPNLSQPAFEALRGSSTEIDRIATETDGVHPLLRLQALAENDRRHALECLDADHGSWGGRWSHICQAEWNLMRELGEKFPNGDCHNVAAVQTARKVSLEAHAGAHETCVSRGRSEELEGLCG